jgi:hypothetical protein
MNRQISSSLTDKATQSSKPNQNHPWGMDRSTHWLDHHLITRQHGRRRRRCRRSAGRRWGLLDNDRALPRCGCVQMYVHISICNQTSPPSQAQPPIPQICWRAPTTAPRGTGGCRQRRSRRWRPGAMWRWGRRAGRAYLSPPSPPPSSSRYLSIDPSIHRSASHQLVLDQWPD